MPKTQIHPSSKFYSHRASCKVKLCSVSTIYVVMLEVAYHENYLTKGNHKNSLCSSYVKSRYAKVVKCVTLQHPAKHLVIILTSLKKFQCSDSTNWVSESVMYWLPLQQCLCVIRHVAQLIRMCLWAVCYNVKFSSARVTDKQILGEIAEDHLIWFKVPTGAVDSKSLEFENFTSRWGLFQSKWRIQYVQQNLLVTV